MRPKISLHKNPTIKQVAETVSEYDMFQPGDTVLLGVSGGPDSIALFHILHALSEDLKIRLAFGHLNHCLRGPAADNDARFAQSVADAYDIPVYLEKIDVRQYKEKHKLSLEEAARDVRYSFLLNVASVNGFNKIAVGHHADDNAEQVLLHLFRGSGPLGMSGIPPIRDGMIVRPLIKLKRDDIIQFLEENRIDYVLDKSNEDPSHLRNRLRYELIPKIKASIQPKITSTLTRFAHITKAEEDWLEQLIKPVFEESINRRLSDRLVVSVDRLNVMHPALQRRILRKAVAEIKGDLRRVTYIHIEAARKLLGKGISHSSIDLPDRIRVSRSGRKLTISKEKTPLREAATVPRQIQFRYRVQKPETVVVKEIGARLQFTHIQATNGLHGLNTGHRIAFFDMNAVKFPLILRNFHPGDRFSPLGMTGTQKVKDFFINNKISREDRGTYPILLSDDRIIWVVGLRIAEPVKVTSKTEIVLKAEMVLLDDV